jgi:hypothetical protein
MLMEHSNKAKFFKKQPEKNLKKLLLKLLTVSFREKKELSNINKSFCSFLGAKEFAAEAFKATSEYATQAGEMLQEKVPEALEGLKIELKEKNSSSFFCCSWKRIRS